MICRYHSLMYVPKVLTRMPTCHVYCGRIQNSQVMESTCVSIIRKMDKGNGMHMHNGMLFSQKQWDHVICKKMDATDLIMLSEIKQVQIRQVSDVLSHVRYLWKDLVWQQKENLQNIRRETEKGKEKQERAKTKWIWSKYIVKINITLNLIYMYK